MQAGVDRARAAMGWIAAAVVLVAAVGVLYLRPSLTLPAAPTAPAGPASEVPSLGDVELTGASFGDADHGVVTVVNHPLRQGSPVASYLTSDGGRTWRQLGGAGIPEGGAKTQLLFLDGTRGVMTMQAADGTQSVRATADGGDTWGSAVPLNSPRPGTRPLTTWLIAHGGRLVAWLLALSADQFSRQGAVFLEGSDPHFDAYPYLFTSGDGGRTWSAPAPGPHLGIRFPVSPVLDARGRLLALEGRRLWVSEDDGATWTARVTQVPADVEPAFFVSAGGGTLFAAGSRAGPLTDLRFVGALLRSTDGGVHWEEVALPAGH